MFQKGFSDILIIIIGLLISAFLVGFFVKSPGFSPGKNIGKNVILLDTDIQKELKKEDLADRDLYCGLNIAWPKTNQIVNSGFMISGYINGCGWVPFEAEAGTVQILDSFGAPISEVILLQIDGDWMSLPAVFNTTINFSSLPKTKTGFIIFTNNDPSGNNPKVINLPIKF